MADGAGYDLPLDVTSLKSISTAIELLKAGESADGLKIDIGGGRVVSDLDIEAQTDLVQRLQGHAAILALISDPDGCSGRLNPRAAPVLHAKVADILDALD